MVRRVAFFWFISSAAALVAFAARASDGGDDSYVNVVCETTQGSIDIVVKPSWAPLGALRAPLGANLGGS